LSSAFTQKPNAASSVKSSYRPFPIVLLLAVFGIFKVSYSSLTNTINHNTAYLSMVGELFKFIGAGSKKLNF
jgi:hypothetical protein